MKREEPERTGRQGGRGGGSGQGGAGRGPGRGGRGRARLRQDLELDSLDFLRLVETIDTATGVDIPERDYPAVATVKGLIGYLETHG
ncbi:acyl carrier protein [Pseudarthrobacter oxydans]|uniref:acyl carrier protein n=1 Tax=Pseudarthrobacter oxydans TaxID=1671 RepID=UPI0027D885C9|nr:phosphopantetheine-binding protein [Pseudarthrobacter oxydans]